MYVVSGSAILLFGIEPLFGIAPNFSSISPQASFQTKPGFGKRLIVCEGYTPCKKPQYAVILIYMKIVKMPRWIILAALPGLLGCLSSGAVRDFTPYAPMGLVSVTSNYDINWVGETTLESDSRSISDFIRKSLSMAPDEVRVRVSKADTLINEADALLRKIITEGEVFRLTGKERLTDTAVYAAAENYQQPNMPEMVIADGYKYLYYRDKAFAGELAGQAAIQSLLYITFEFNKQMVSGFGKIGKARARVVMTANMVDPAGKIIYSNVIETYSNDTIEVKDGAYAHDELMDLFREPIAEACYRFVWDFIGVPKKAR
jgi:hypothetical protein